MVTPVTKTVLYSSRLDTPLGPMLAVSNKDALYLLEFLDGRGVEREVERLKYLTKSTITPGDSAPIHSIEKELQAYFNGLLKEFGTPFHLMGSPFQKRVWHELTLIPYGTTTSYSQQAEALGKPTAFRAVANANGANQLAIIVPCHRIINLNGNLGGYGGGVERKKWLIDQERNNK